MTFAQYWMLLITVLVSLCYPAYSQPSAAEADHKEHEALRTLLLAATTAVNEKKFDHLHESFHPKLRVTTVNQGLITKPEELEPYFRSWVGPDQYVHFMHMTMEADELTQFYGQGDTRFGVARGKGVEDYDLADGRHLKLDTRWTATVVKDDRGQWKILALHIGTNFYKNPIVEQFQAANKIYGAAGLGSGLLLGIALTQFLKRKKTG